MKNLYLPPCTRNWRHIFYSLSHVVPELVMQHGVLRYDISSLQVGWMHFLYICFFPSHRLFVLACYILLGSASSFSFFLLISLCDSAVASILQTPLHHTLPLWILDDDEFNLIWFFIVPVLARFTPCFGLLKTGPCSRFLIPFLFLSFCHSWPYTSLIRCHEFEFF